MDKVITNKGEFTWDLVSAAPHAYWCELNNVTYRTIGVIGSRPFFYFSPTHKEIGDRKTDSHICYQELEAAGCMSNQIYDENPPLKQWTPPPYKEVYKNKTFVYKKPIMVINNKYTEEWGKDPVNFIPEHFLAYIVKKFKKKYQIIYIRPDGNGKRYGNDYNVFFDFKDQERNAMGNDVIYFDDICAEYSEKSYNELQLMVHANSDRFVSALGGNSTLCSYFGGKNLVVYGGGHLGGHRGYYKLLSGCEITLMRKEEDIKKYL